MFIVENLENTDLKKKEKITNDTTHGMQPLIF